VNSSRKGIFLKQGNGKLKLIVEQVKEIRVLVLAKVVATVIVVK